MDKCILTLITFLPLLGAVIVLLLPGSRAKLIRAAAAVATGIVFLLTLYLWAVFDPSGAASGVGQSAYDARTFFETPWIAPYHIYYRVGVDGL